MKKYFKIFILIIFCSACIREQGSLNECKTIKINPNETTGLLDIEPYYDADFIALETSQASHIGTIQKIILYDSLLYILDKQQSKLLVFDMNGDYIRTIGKRGKGVGEYIRIADFNIFNEELMISSLRNNKMLHFSLDGKLITEIKYNDYIGLKFYPSEDGVVTYGKGGSNKSACFYNFNGKLKSFLSNEHMNFLNHSPMNTYTSYNKNVSSIFALNDTVYNVDFKNQTLNPEVVFDFGAQKVNLGNIANFDDLLNYLQKRKGKYLKLEKFHKICDDYYFLLENGENFINGLYFTNNNSSCLGNQLSYKNLILRQTVGFFDDGLIALWHPAIIPLIKKNEGKIMEFLPEKCLNADESWNPGVVILKKKK